MPSTERARPYTAADFLPPCEPEGHVVVVGGGQDEPQQLYFCPTVQDTATPRGLLAVSLEDGQYCRLLRDSVVGALKPELLPDSARMHLSQVRPTTATRPEGEVFSAYCFLQDGRYSGAVPCFGTEGAMAYVQQQSAYQHRIMLCDSGDCCVFEMIDGEVVFPTKAMLGQHAENTGGIGMIQ